MRKACRFARSEALHAGVVDGRAQPHRGQVATSGDASPDPSIPHPTPTDEVFSGLAPVLELQDLQPSIPSGCGTSHQAVLPRLRVPKSSRLLRVASGPDPHTLHEVARPGRCLLVPSGVGEDDSPLEFDAPDRAGGQEGCRQEAAGMVAVVRVPGRPDRQGLPPSRSTSSFSLAVVSLSVSPVSMAPRPISWGRATPGRRHGPARPRRS